MTEPQPNLTTELLQDPLEHKIQAIGLPEVAREAFAEIRRQSLGFLLAKDFIAFWQSQPPETKGSAYCLGLTKHELSESVMRECNLKGWREGFKELGIKYEGESNKIRNAVNNAKYLRLAINNTVVYLVPPELFTHPKGEYTKREMWYFLKHPKRAKNAYFVFL